jgi:N-acetyl-anhydromuramyl-L-alanine amidase AmpD
VPLYWPLRSGRIITSRFGQRGNEFHTGTDFGFPGGSAGAPVYAIDSGTVRYCGAADGYGGPDPCGWIVVESPSGCWEYGHIRRLSSIKVGAKVRAGEQIATVNPDSNTNGGTAPHLHLSYMAGVYNANLKSDPLPRLAGAADPPAGAQPMTEPRPDFNEYAKWSPNNQSRNGTRPDLWIIHTQEGNGNADSLAQYFQGDVGVSYHYTVSQDPRDNGVTVCDVVDTDLASWSVLSANNRSINLCFAGSSASWSRGQWLTQSRAIDVAAYLCVNDCRKYGIPLAVIAPPYTAGRAGITDHAYVTKVLGDGTHTDVGPNFPWDHFTQRIQYWQNPTPKPPPAPKPVTLDDIKAQLDRIERMLTK